MAAKPFTLKMQVLQQRLIKKNLFALFGKITKKKK
jgi:hypothetical protein